MGDNRTSDIQWQPIAPIALFVLGLVALFLPWYGISITLFGTQLNVSTNGLGSTLSASAFGSTSHTSWLPANWIFVLGLLAVGVAAYQSYQLRQHPGSSTQTYGQLLAVGAILEFVGAIVYLIAATANMGKYASYGTVGIGLILAILVSVAGGSIFAWLRLQDHSTPGLPTPHGLGGDA